MSAWAVPGTTALVALAVFAVTDARSRRVPNRLMAGAYVATALGVGLAAAVTGDWRQALARVVLALALLALGVLLWAGGPSRLGGGDVKVFGLMGLGLGLVGVLGLLLGDVLAGMFVGARALARGRSSWREPIPLVSFLAVGSFVCVLVLSMR